MTLEASTIKVPTGLSNRLARCDDNGNLIVAGATFTPTAGSGIGTLTLANTDYTVLAANLTRKFLMIQNTSVSASVTLNLLGAIAYSSGLVGITIPAGGMIILDVAVPNTAIHAASATAGATLFIVEG